MQRQLFDKACEAMTIHGAKKRMNEPKVKGLSSINIPTEDFLGFGELIHIDRKFKDDEDYLGTLTLSFEELFGDLDKEALIQLRDEIDRRIEK